MSATSPVIVILGAGSNIGQTVGKFFAAKGYKVALAARSLNEADSTENQLHIASDFSNTDDVVNVFKKVKSKLGIPSVVVYNASARSPAPADDPLSLSLDAFNKSVTINIRSVFVAAQQAVQGFAKLPESASKTFIVTGNILNVVSLPGFLDQGVGKSGSAHLIWAASEAYKNRGFKFYYADERKLDGSAIYRVNGDAHASHFWDLSQSKTQGPWLQSFVKGIGYKDFGPYKF
ncbi:uncharacterized protein V1516DRAFT_666260 [Lipomyces oligophaga]|uniref:uncharacterized protein n=1 Tax=Lipomyces oligophaga TaxID=45792 RepID=UPI0034CF37F9